MRFVIRSTELLALALCLVAIPGVTSRKDELSSSIFLSSSSSTTSSTFSPAGTATTLSSTSTAYTTTADSYTTTVSTSLNNTSKSKKSKDKSTAASTTLSTTSKTTKHGTTITTPSTTLSTTSKTKKTKHTSTTTTTPTTWSTVTTSKTKKHTKTIHVPTSGTNTVSHRSRKPSSTQSLQTLAPSQVQQVAQSTSRPQHPWGPSFIPSGKNGLPQSSTNGKSPLGTFNAPQFPPWIGHTSGSSPPWGGRTAGNTNAYQDAPSTGVTRYYNFVITRQTIAPDGVERSVILVNGEFPGPTLEANWGDEFSVTVTNLLEDEGTSIHWHGILQKGTPYMDGVPGIHSCPMAPGQNFTYTFQADLYGSSWWHAHYSAQYAGGLFGAMIIHGPRNVDYDIDVGPILLTDYYHDDYYTLVEEVMGTDLSLVSPHSINNLINGKGVYNCSLLSDPSTCTPDAGLSHFSFQSGQSHRLRLINAGAEGVQKFSIDGHTMQVMAYDFVPIVPYDTEIVTLGVGQRADAIVQANYSSTSSWWMRSTISSCSLGDQPIGLAMIYYEDADTSLTPNSTAWVDTTVPCANDPLSETTPYFPIVPTEPEIVQDITLNFGTNATGHLLWTMDGSSFRVDYNDPLLELAVAGNDSYPDSPEWNVYDLGSATSIRVVLNNLTPVGHPMHMHGHNFYVMSEGTGSWDGSLVNPNNPTRRDIQMLQPNGYIVVQFEADNPGVWPFHCHIAWHVSGGLYVNFLERPDEIPERIQIPSANQDLCTSWDAWTNGHVVDVIDSGL